MLARHMERFITLVNRIDWAKGVIELDPYDSCIPILWLNHIIAAPTDVTDIPTPTFIRRPCRAISHLTELVRRGMPQLARVVGAVVAIAG